MLCFPVSVVPSSGTAAVKVRFLLTTRLSGLPAAAPVGEALMDAGKGVPGGTISIVQRPQADRRSGKTKNNALGNKFLCKSLIFRLIICSITGAVAIIQGCVLRYLPAIITV